MGSGDAGVSGTQPVWSYWRATRFNAGELRRCTLLCAFRALLVDPLTAFPRLAPPQVAWHNPLTNETSLISATDWGTFATVGPTLTNLTRHDCSHRVYAEVNSSDPADYAAHQWLQVYQPLARIYTVEWSAQVT